ncbi:hypothetical protein T02_8593 [Trichinella nativa]|uniref:Uncharacterized protein n=1 Tax=Trichinella nativa TaxID=6335 RepID=A0A0V1L269_9BILA|nr:hypothetical protein T02_8593 [Trichinella nativa]
MIIRNEKYPLVYPVLPEISTAFHFQRQQCQVVGVCEKAAFCKLKFINKTTRPISVDCLDNVRHQRSRVSSRSGEVAADAE